MKKYRYITIRQVDNETFENKPVYRIFNNRTKAQLGIISWYKPWMEYVFSGDRECVLNITCLKDVIDFIGQEFDFLYENRILRLKVKSS